MINKNGIGYLAAFTSALLLGAMGLFVRNINADPYVVTFYRLGIGLVFLFLFLMIKKEVKGIRLQKWNWNLLFTGILLATTSLCYIKAIHCTTLANAVFLLYLGPLMAVGLAAVLIKEKLTYVSIGLLIVAFSGFLFLIEFKFTINSAESQGYIWGIISALCYALYIILNRQMPATLSAPIRSFYQLLCGTLFVVPFLNSSVFQLTTTDMIWLVAIGFFHGFLAFTLIILSLKYLKAVQYGTISYIEPLFAALIGWFVFSESLSMLQMIGCAVILIGGMLQVVASQKLS